MKIGIMTFWWSEDNYGQLLQCYALQKYLRDLGHDAYVIKYDPRNDYSKKYAVKRFLKIFNPIKLINYLKKQYISKKEIKQNLRKFSEFRKKYINFSDELYTSYTELKQIPPLADVYIVGSDQVWNNYDIPLNEFKNILNAYFLNFGTNEVKRISYAASWGKIFIDKSYRKAISGLLKKFNYVSVRETTGIKLCEMCNYNMAEKVYDPTLLLEANCYRNIYKSTKSNYYNSFLKEKYLFLYLLDNKFEIDINVIYKFADSKNLKVIYVTGNSLVEKKETFSASIPEWLFLVDHAEYIVTNSFHACVFSLIFNKQFGVIPRIGNTAGMNDRLNSLFLDTNINSRFLNSEDLSILDETYEISMLEANLNFLNAF